ncbi:hypothetical protein [Piscinibacter sp.]|uniref:hypothetical protein n=1 Tax=Piscinibacter sp. TaxID=1903157 RepID=UPI0035599072
MQPRGSGWSETWRVLAYTLAVALAFIALGRLQLAAFNAVETEQLLARVGLLDRHPEAQLQQLAAQIAAASRDALQRLPPGHRFATLRLGYELGYASQWVGAYAMSPANVQATARAVGDAHLAQAREQALLLGVPEVGALPVRNLKEFAALNQRFEADENGVAARVQQQLSPLHRHLYLLGVHLGTEAARVEGSGGQFALPPAALIRRHATLAGIEPALWEPLTIAPHNETAAQVLRRYRAALNALAAGMVAPSEAPDRPRGPEQ